MGYSNKIKATLKSKYETGDYSFDALGDKYGISTATIENWKKLYKWRKGKTRENIKKKVAEKIETDTIKIMASLEMPKKKFLGLLLNRALKTEMLKTVKVPAKDAGGKVIRNKKGVPSIIEQTITVLDNVTMHKYAQDLIKVCGYDSAPKKAIEDKEDQKDKESIPVRQYIPTVKKS